MLTVKMMTLLLLLAALVMNCRQIKKDGNDAAQIVRNTDENGVDESTPAVRAFDTPVSTFLVFSLPPLPRQAYS